MTQYLIMCPTLTWAQKVQKTLERAGIGAAVVKAPQSLTEAGCGYAVSLYRRFDDAERILRKRPYKRKNIPTRGKRGIYADRSRKK